MDLHDEMRNVLCDFSHISCTMPSVPLFSLQSSLVYEFCRKLSKFMDIDRKTEFFEASYYTIINHSRP